MPRPILEHVNMTVANPERTAKILCDLFDWEVRWHGSAINQGITYHVGSDTSYLALYSGQNPNKATDDNYETIGGLNHLGIVVDDIDAMEERVKKAGFEPRSHADYEPGRRFYFYDNDNIEFEIVSYTSD